MLDSSIAASVGFDFLRELTLPTLDCPAQAFVP